MTATIRDQYAMAALTGLLADPKVNGTAEQFAGSAAAVVDAMVVEACKRWGHIRSVDRCERCGPTLERTPVPKVRIPGHPIGCPCCTEWGPR